MKKQTSALILLILLTFSITISSIRAYSTVNEDPKLKCISYNFWNPNNTGWETFYQVDIKTPDTFYIAGETSEDLGDIFLMEFNESQTSLEELNCSLYEWGGGNLEDFGGFAIDPQNNIYITGNTYSFGAGNSDIFLTKMDKYGQSLWNRTWGTADYEAIDSEFGGIVIDSEENVYITGFSIEPGISEEVCIIKYAPSGAQLWNRTWKTGDVQNRPMHMIIDVNDNIYIAGTSFFHNFLLCYDKLGNLEWETSWEVPFGFGLNSYVNDLLLSGGNVLLGETLVYELNSDFKLRQFNQNGEEIYNLTLTTPGAEISFGGMIENSKNEIIFYGHYGPYNDMKPFIGEYNLLGNYTWMYGVDKWRHEIIHDISLDNSDNIYLCGGNGREDDQDLYILKFNSVGKFLWYHVWGSDEEDIALSLYVDTQGIIYAFGNTEGIPGHSRSVIIAKFKEILPSEGPNFWIFLIIGGVLGVIVISSIIFIKIKKR